MKLSSVLQVLKESNSLIKELVSVTINSGAQKEFRSLIKFNKAIKDLKKIEIFNDKISSLNSLIIGSVDDNIIMNFKDGRVFENSVVELSKDIDLLSRSLSEIIINDDQREEFSIYIKLPNTTNLSDISKDINTFNKILSNTILNESINGQIMLESIEPGSIWLKIYVGSSLAVSVIGSLAWSSAVVYKKYEEARIIEEIANRKKLENDHKKNVIEASKLITDLVVEAEAENIYKTYYKNGETEPEQIERLKASIKMLSEEINKGAEISPSLMAPEEVSNLFPNMKSLPTIESKIKKIEK